MQRQREMSRRCKGRWRGGKGEAGGKADGKKRTDRGRGRRGHRKQGEGERQGEGTRGEKTSKRKNSEQREEKARTQEHKKMADEKRRHRFKCSGVEGVGTIRAFCSSPGRAASLCAYLPYTAADSLLVREWRRGEGGGSSARPGEAWVQVSEEDAAEQRQLGEGCPLAGKGKAGHSKDATSRASHLRPHPGVSALT